MMNLYSLIQLFNTVTYSKLCIIIVISSHLKSSMAESMKLLSKCGETWCVQQKQYCDESTKTCTPCSTKCFKNMDFFEEKECKQHCQGYLDAQAKLAKEATTPTPLHNMATDPSQVLQKLNIILNHEQTQTYVVLFIAAVIVVSLFILMIRCVVKFVKKRSSHARRIRYSNNELCGVNTEQKQLLSPPVYPNAPINNGRMDYNVVDIHKDDKAKNTERRSVEISEKDDSSLSHPQEQDAGLGQSDEVTNQSIMHPEQI